MNRYSLYCTEAQTRKALDLGAPIWQYENAIVSADIPHYTEWSLDGNDSVTTICPTAEQMCGWLEEQGAQIMLLVSVDNKWSGQIYDTSIKGVYGQFCADTSNFSTRKEATLAAIDAALEYLTYNKK